MTENPRAYTDEMNAFIIEHGAELSTRELQQELNEKFGCNRSFGSVKRKTQKFGIQKSRDAISRGHKHSKYPIGSSRIINGYEYIKVTTSGAGFYNQWDRKCRIVWRQHYGDIPEGHQIVFLNGDTLDCNIENLACISTKVCAKMSNGHGKAFWSENPEVTKTGLLVCELDLALKENGKVKSYENKT